MAHLHEDPEVHPSDVIVANDDDCSLVLTFFEKEPFYEQKKKILQIEDSSPQIRVKLPRSPCSDWASTTLDFMLQRVRIIHLNEVELYFFGVDVVLPAESISTRNELESLNSILSIIDTSLSSDTCKRTKVLQQLRDATVDAIGVFGDTNADTMRTEKCSCDPEGILLQWGESLGVRTKLQIAHVEGAGRGAVAAEDLKVGDTALEIPESVIICQELVYESDMYDVLKEVNGISGETMSLLWSMKERYNPDSKFKIYFETLPEAFNTGLSFGIDALTALEGTLLFDEIIQAKEHLRAQYDELFPALCSKHPEIFRSELYTWVQFLWACELWYSNSMKVLFTDGEMKTCLVPIAGFLNHSICPHIMHYGKLDSATNSLKFPLSRPCRKGEQCYLSYGNFSSSHLITFYGFLPKLGNPYDIIPLDIDIPESSDSRDQPRPEWSTHMVRATWLSSKYEIFHYCLPPSLLDYLREALKDAELQTKMHTQESMKLEKDVLYILLSIFDPMLEKLGDVENIDREKLDWDVKLALDFKDLQRGIVSSVTTSCYGGLKMLDIEMHNMKDS